MGTWVMQSLEQRMQYLKKLVLWWSPYHVIHTRARTPDSYMYMQSALNKIYGLHVMCDEGEISHSGSSYVRQHGMEKVELQLYGY